MMDKELLNKYFAGDSSQQEKEKIQLWLEESEENKKEYMALRTLYDITTGHYSESEDTGASGKKRKHALSGREWLRIAAAILITFSCTYSFFMSKQVTTESKQTVSMQTLHIPAGQRAELILTDSTKVWLNALTTFTFPDKFGENSREVYLDGEAYFDVSHDPDKKFTVNTGKHKINVLGTEFNVLSYSKTNIFETSLLKGSIEIVSQDNMQKVTLTAGEKILLKDNRFISENIQHYDYFLWKKGIISFDQERMEDIFNKLQLYYDVQISNRNPVIKDMRYSGKFRTKDGIEHVLNVLKIPTGLTYTKENDSNLITVH